MTSIRDFSLLDLFDYNKVNLDNFTETFGNSFYMWYMSNWPEYFKVAFSFNGDISGYFIGKVEGNGNEWHGHVSAVSVAPEYRRLGLARNLMDQLEEVTEEIHNAWFVDLFVRESNKVAIEMYKKLGYEIYRTVVGYYRSDSDINKKENGLDMRKPMRRDKKKISLRCKKRRIKPEELQWD